MRRLAPLLLLALLALAGLPSAQPAAVTSPCTPVPLEELETACPAIRPGARMGNGCTLNFVVTDGVDLYVGTARHCTSLGARLTVQGVPGEVGTCVWVGARRDAAFFRIDPEDVGFVDPTMARWGGPVAGPTGANVRLANPGETLLYYGHGTLYDQSEATRGRAGVAAYDGFAGGARILAFVGAIDGGDSGSPIRAETGEAVGIATAATGSSFATGLVGGVLGVPLPGTGYQVGLGESFVEVLKDFRKDLGRPVVLVEGRPPVDASAD